MIFIKNRIKRNNSSKSSKKTSNLSTVFTFEYYAQPMIMLLKFKKKKKKMHINLIEFMYLNINLIKTIVG